MIDQECRLKHTQGLLTGLAVSTIGRAIAEGWRGDDAATAQQINATFAQHGFAWRLVRLQ
jgi:hypothetical protein